jgi:S-layer homology domain
MRRFSVTLLALAALLAGGAAGAVREGCGPFTDVPSVFCPVVAELFYAGISVGTSPTTFSPESPITRGQAAVFVAKGLDQALKRTSRHAALGQWWTTTPRYFAGLGTTTIPGASYVYHLAADGTDLWAAASDSVWRIRASDGKLLEEWTGANAAFGTLVAMGRVFVAGSIEPSGPLYMIDPSQPAGPVTTVAPDVGSGPTDLAFDGSRIWVADDTPTASVAIVTPGPVIPWTVTIVTNPAFAFPFGLVFDGTNMWMTDNRGDGVIYKLDPAGGVLQTVPVGSAPAFPVFDGTNIWVPNTGSESVTVIRASTGTVVATLTGNGLSVPYQAAFDGERILVTNIAGSVSLFKAADFSQLGSYPTSWTPTYVCSDGLNFWIALIGPGQVARF